jgi:hypothetical protein
MATVQRPISQRPVAFEGAHADPQVPQWVLLAVTSVSHPFAASPSQSPRPVAHAPTPQVPARHTAVPPGAVQAVPQRPQWLVLTRVSVSHPFAGLPSQSAKPVVHATMRHTAPIHMAVATLGPLHERPQLPQCSIAVASSVSQPSLVTPLHSPKPAAQVTAHTAPTHAGTVLRGVGHALPHAPHDDTLVRRSVSQPLAAFMSQSPNPIVHVPTPQVPPTHVAVALAALHDLPHAPHDRVLVRVSTLHPLAASPSQSAKPVVQA